MDKPQQVVIVGGGFGGLFAARALKRTPVQVTLIDRRNFHLFQPLLYQIATGGLSPANIAAPLRGLLKRQRNAEVHLGGHATGTICGEADQASAPRREPASIPVQGPGQHGRDRSERGSGRSGVAARMGLPCVVAVDIHPSVVSSSVPKSASRAGTVDVELYHT